MGVQGEEGMGGTEHIEVCTRKRLYHLVLQLKGKLTKPYEK